MRASDSLVFIYRDRLSPCSPGWLGICCIDHAAPELAEIAVSVSLMLGLKV